MEQTKVINALAPFLALAKSASSPRQAADIVTQATSASNTYVFAELLQTSAVQSLRSDEQYVKHYKLLELFTWGTWAEYKDSQADLPALSDAQSQKLRLLSLLTFAATASSSSALTYNALMDALSLASTTELQDLVTTAIYADLLKASLDPAAGLVRVSSVSPLRDLRPGTSEQLIQELAAWEQRCIGVLAEIQGQIDEVKRAAETKGRKDGERERQEARAERKWGGPLERADDDAGGDSLRAGLRRKGMKSRGEGDMMDVDGGPFGRK